MHRIALFALIVGCLFASLGSAPAQAQASRTWVSALGDDINACTRTAPCKTFAQAMINTAAGGEINCVDAGSFGTVTIAKSLAIDCQDVYGSILGTGTTGVIINAANITVTIRNINIDGAGTGLKGISILAGARVNIENVMVMGFTQQGISDTRGGVGGMLTIRNSTIRNNGAAGITSASPGNSGTVLENVHLVSNAFGVAVGSGNNAVVSRSVIAANTTAGIQSDAGSKVVVDNTLISHNATGVSAQGSVQLANSNILFNSTGIFGASTSYGNNRIFGNTSAGTAPGVGAATTDHGQQ